MAGGSGLWTWENQETARDLVEHWDGTLAAVADGRGGAASAAGPPAAWRTGCWSGNAVS